MPRDRAAGRPGRSSDRTRRFGGRSPKDRSGELHGIGDIIEGLLRERALSRGLPLGRLAARWTDVVGAGLAEVTAPVRLDGGVLHLRVATSAWAAQVRFLARDIVARANEVLDGPEATPASAPGDPRGTGQRTVREVTVSVGGER